MAKSREMIVLIGIPGCGKTTFAMNFIKQNQNYARISRDDIRINMFGREHDPSIENHVTKIQNDLIKQCLTNNINVVIDNCNIKQSYRNDLIKIAQDIGGVMYKEIVINTDLNTCIERNANRSRVVPENVIVDFYKKGKDVLNRKKEVQFFIPEKVMGNLIQDDSLPRAIICDLDGTLALLNGRNPYDASTCENDLINEPVATVVEIFSKLASYEIIFCSGRMDQYRQQTINFIEKHLDIASYKLFMRKTNDQRKDSIIKEEIYNEKIKGKYFIEFVLDDRNQVVDFWRSIGLTTFQVNYGDF